MEQGFAFNAFLRDITERKRRRGGARAGARRGARGVAAEVRVPGQHEPRDPHADERRDRHDRAAARHRARRASSASYAETVARVGRRAADDHQRHPRLLEDRGRQARARADRLRPARRRRATSCELLADAGARARASSCVAAIDADVPRRRARRRRPAAPGARSTWSATRSSSPTRARSSCAATPMPTTAHAVLALRGLATPASASPPEPRRAASSSRSRRPTARRPARYGGTGLGLAICQPARRADGRRRSASTSELGRGSTFWFEPPTCARAAPATARPATPSSPALRVLVVDDNATNREHPRAPARVLAA